MVGRPPPTHIAGMVLRVCSMAWLLYVVVSPVCVYVPAVVSAISPYFSTPCGGRGSAAAADEDRRSVLVEPLLLRGIRAPRALLLHSAHVFSSPWKLLVVLSECEIAAKNEVDYTHLAKRTKARSKQTQFKSRFHSENFSACQ